MKKLLYFIISWLLLFTAVGLTIFYRQYTIYGERWIFHLTTISLMVIAITLYFFAMQKSLPPAYNVAIVGFLQSGKTTLITTLFRETFARKIQKIRMTPRGTKTIEKINAYMEMLQKGKALGPTKDQDRFSFRADDTVKRFLFLSTFKVEFGDYPGQDSQAYSEKYGPWLHTTEFFKWVADSDAIIFVIDLGRYLYKDELRTDYIAKISSALRAAWQHFLDVNEYRVKKVRKHPVVLVFTKADLFDVELKSGDWTHFEQEIWKLGFGPKTPAIKEIDHEMLNKGQDRVRQDFVELIKYFETEAPNFHVLFASCFGLIQGKLLGINDLLKAILPH